MALKQYKTAKGILQASIRDIEAGHWCKGALADFPSALKTEVKNEGEEHPLDEFNYGDHMLAKDPLGCALGLICLHGGEAREVEASNGKTYKLYEVEQPTDSSPEPIKDAVRALASVIPKGTKAHTTYLSGHRPHWRLFNDFAQAVVTYNDNRNMRRDRALVWFKNALDSLDAGNKAGGSGEGTP